MRLHESFDNLEESAETCRCCRFLVTQIAKPAGFVFKKHRQPFVYAIGSGRHGLTHVLIGVGGCKLRTYLNAVADPGRTLRRCQSYENAD